MHVLLVGVGGALGSIARYLVSLAVDSPGGAAFPLGTLIVNVAGCAGIGVAAGLLEHRVSFVSAEAWALVVTGFLGGFTTFSAFGLETTRLLGTAGRLAVLNLLLQLGLGLAAVFAGRTLGRALAAFAS